MNTSTALVAILGIIISILLLKRGKAKKIPIIALVIFIILFLSSFSNSNKTQKDKATTSSNTTAAINDNDFEISNSANTETPTPSQNIEHTSSPKGTTIPTEEIVPTEAITTTIEIAPTKEEISTQDILETDASFLSEDKEESKQFTLSWNDLGKYGEEITLNKGTDTALTFIAFRIPAGIYSVKNNAERGASQVTVYSGIIENGQSEELSNEGCPFPIVIMAGKDPQILEIKEGQFIKLSENSSNIEFVLQE